MPHKISSVFVACLLALLSLGFSASEHKIYGQLAKIENRIPKNVPIKVEFKNYEKENWWHEIEVKVTNIGKKPIYYLYLILGTDRKGPNGNEYVFPLSFGDSRKMLSTEAIAAGDEPAILPGESLTLRIDHNSAKAWDLAKASNEFVEPSLAELRHQWTNFGDGTGLRPGGTSFKKKL
jgi:hypothetical protein